MKHLLNYQKIFYNSYSKLLLKRSKWFFCFVQKKVFHSLKGFLPVCDSRCIISKLLLSHRLHLNGFSHLSDMKKAFLTLIMLTSLVTMFTLICLLTSVNPCMYIKMTFFLQNPRHNDYMYMDSPQYGFCMYLI